MPLQSATPLTESRKELFPCVYALNHTRSREQRSAARMLRKICTGFEVPAKGGRLAKAKVYPFRQLRLGKYYEHKRVEVIYTVEGETIVTVTVYVFYGKWED